MSDMKMYDLEEMISLSKRAAQIVPDCGQMLIEAAIHYGRVNELVVNNILEEYDIEHCDLEDLEDYPPLEDLQLFI
jgi:hypothetical protein|tara:strand:- start:150 stop:377 length:228 start_codon:yes stop_codon:yes gene_type:complete